MRSILLSALLGLCVATQPLQAQQTDDADQLVKQGVALYDQGKYDEAVLRYKQALKQDPKHYTAAYELAMTYNSLNRNEEAVALCKQLLKNDPEPGPNLYGTYGNALDGLKKSKEAAKIYQEGIKRHPNDGSLYFNLGVTQAASLGQMAEATVSMQQAVRCRPTHTNSLNALALLTQQEGNRVPALLEMLRLLQLEPTGQRAEATLARFEKLVGQGVKQTGEKAVTINISPETLKNSGKKGRPDNFAGADMLLSMSGALDFDAKNKDKTPNERLTEKLTTLLGSLEEQHPEKQEGFVWQYFVPYFVALKNEGHLPALVYTIQVSRAETTPDVKQWLAAHQPEVQALNSWSEAYIWPK